MVTSNLKEVIDKNNQKLSSEAQSQQIKKKKESNENLDVEYEADLEEVDLEGDLIKKKGLEEKESKPSTERDFSISLWNGSPLLPNWKNPNHIK